MDTTNIKHGEYIGGEKLPDNLVKLLSESDTIAIDTEADSLHHYFHRVCLIQLNVNENYFIIDPLQCKDMEKLFSLFADKLIILHGGDYDIRVMKRDFGFIPHKVFDTMIAMQLLGYEKLGLADLVERHFRIVLAKGPQKMDWSMRPLPEKMITYAVNDVKYLLKLHKILMNELEEKNRVNWVEENCAHLIESSVADKGENDELWRIKGSYVLNRAELEYLKELWLWREEEAKLTNVPVFRIFKNEWLLELARWCAQEKEKPLTESPLYGLISPWKERAYRAQTAINKARKTKPSKWPFVKKPVLGKRKDVDPEIMELLKKKRDEIATDLKVDPHVILNHKSLATVASAHIDNGNFSETEDLQHFYNWQKELLWPSFIKIINDCIEEKNKKRKLKKSKKTKRSDNHSAAADTPNRNKSHRDSEKAGRKEKSGGATPLSETVSESNVSGSL